MPDNFRGFEREVIRAICKTLAVEINDILSSPPPKLVVHKARAIGPTTFVLRQLKPVKNVATD